MPIRTKNVLITILLYISFHFELPSIIQENNLCNQFHIGFFAYESDYGILKIERTSNKSYAYRIYPSSYVIDSIEWISPCLAKQTSLTINDELIKNNSNPLGTTSYLKITNVFENSYEFQLLDAKKRLLAKGLVKRIKSFK
jgi:hypothetical protein